MPASGGKTLLHACAHKHEIMCSTVEQIAQCVMMHNSRMLLLRFSCGKTASYDMQKWMSLSRAMKQTPSNAIDAGGSMYVAYRLVHGLALCNRCRSAGYTTFTGNHGSCLLDWQRNWLHKGPCCMGQGGTCMHAMNCRAKTWVQGLRA